MLKALVLSVMLSVTPAAERTLAVECIPVEQFKEQTWPQAKAAGFRKVWSGIDAYGDPVLIVQFRDVWMFLNFVNTPEGPEVCKVLSGTGAPKFFDV
jgi:hypothetical protein